MSLVFFEPLVPDDASTTPAPAGLPSPESTRFGHTVGRATPSAATVKAYVPGFQGARCFIEWEYLLAWMPTDKKKPNRTPVRFHGFSAISWDCRSLSGLSMYRVPPR